MPIRSIDYQVIIPKATEVQKIKQTEIQNPQNNNNIGMHKQQEQNERDLKKVNDTKKAYKSRIKKDGSNKQQGKENQNEEEQKDKKDKQNDKPSIDIRI
ncbi:MAG: hypothetical protein WBL93_13875 [Lutisporaceae bacterium]